ncbi:MAG: amidase [Actinomycetia bacterium]|nr:amidase [Actinomycetes bacterium]
MPQTATYQADDFAALDATQCAAIIHSGAASADEVQSAAQARIAAANPSLNAITTAIFDIGQYRGRQAAPFSGVPIVVKDNENLAGTQTSHGSNAVPRTVSRATSPFVSQLLELGFTILAKTTLPEFGLTATTESDRFGATRNPWNTDHTVGGSSGGSAALVAAGAVPLAHANDGGGSTRIPASCAGLVGLKPSRGRLIAPEGTEQMPVNVVAQGAVTRTVRDTANLYAALEQLRPAQNLPPIGSVTRPGSRRLRIAFCPVSFGEMPAAPTTVAALQQTAELCQELGHHVVQIDNPVPEQFGRDFLRYWGFLALALSNFGTQLFGDGFDKKQVTDFVQSFGRFSRGQLAGLPATISRLRGFAAEYESARAGYDVILTPTLGREPPPIGYLGPGVAFRTHVIRLMRFASFTAPQNVSGTPAISLPTGCFGPNGVPLGAQFSGALGSERMLLELAFEIEEAQPWGQPG